MYQIVAKCNNFDVFMNQYSTAISASKLHSNSNSQVCINEEHSFYSTKYSIKKTQDDDQGDYNNVLHYVNARFDDIKFDEEKKRSILKNYWC